MCDGRMSNICSGPLSRLVRCSIQRTSGWTRPLVMSLKQRKGQIMKGLVMANHTHTWWRNMTRLTQGRDDN